MAEPSFFDGRILIIDDDPVSAAVLRATLRTSDYSDVDAESDPCHGVVVAARSEPDLLIVDLHMPQLDGLEVMRAVRETRDEDDFLPVLMLTAEHSVEAKQRALAAGVTDFLTKPFDPAETLLRVRNLLAVRAINLRAKAGASAMQRRLDKLAGEQYSSAQGVADRRQRIEHALAVGEPVMVFQPIIDLTDGSIVGAEALARFSATPYRTPDVWFAEAVEVGLDISLELAAIATALSQLADFPPEAYVSINMSPRTLISDHLIATLAGHSHERIVVELTEHVEILDYTLVATGLSRLRSLGVRLAVDDTGAGFSSLQHVLRLEPEIIKLDRLLVKDIETNPAKRAMAAALVAFGRDADTVVVAEGIETRSELDILTGLGISYGQGYYLGRPQPLPLEAADLMRSVL